MKLLFNLDVTEDKRVRARPSDYLKSLPEEQQITAVTEFLGWAENELRNSTDPQGTRRGQNRRCHGEEVYSAAGRIRGAHLHRQKWQNRR